MKVTEQSLLKQVPAKTPMQKEVNVEDMLITSAVGQA